DEAIGGSPRRSPKKRIAAFGLAALTFIVIAVITAVMVQNQKNENKQGSLSKISALEFNPETDCSDVTARTIDYDWPTYFPTYLPTISPVEDVVLAAIGSEGEKLSLDENQLEGNVDGTPTPSESPIVFESNDVGTDDNFIIIYDDDEYGSEDDDGSKEGANRAFLPEIFERRSLSFQSSILEKGVSNDESSWSVRRKMLKSLSEDARQQKCVDYIVESIMADKTPKTPKTPKTTKSTSTKTGKSKKGENPSTPSPTVSRQPSSEPSESKVPSKSPSDTPSFKPSKSPSDVPSKSPSDTPSFKPSKSPSDVPSKSPSDMPSFKPSRSPSDIPSSKPSKSPSDIPSSKPSKSPFDIPSSKPSKSPSDEPSSKPSTSQSPSKKPSFNPSPSPVVLGSCPAGSPSVIGQNCQFNPTQVRTCCLDQSNPQAIACSNCANCGLGLVSTVSNADQDCCVDNGSTDVGGSSCDATYKYCCKRALSGGAAASRYKCFNEDDIPSGLSATAYCASL
ncbi:hypothetical protein ACHAXS_005521, partial [Conticribra weissflogii]